MEHEDHPHLLPSNAASGTAYHGTVWDAPDFDIGEDWSANAFTLLDSSVSSDSPLVWVTPDVWAAEAFAARVNAEGLRVVLRGKVEVSEPLLDYQSVYNDPDGIELDGHRLEPPFDSDEAAEFVDGAGLGGWIARGSVCDGNRGFSEYADVALSDLATFDVDAVKVRLNDDQWTPWLDVNDVLDALCEFEEVIDLSAVQARLAQCLPAIEHGAGVGDIDTTPLVSSRPPLSSP